MKWYTKQLSEIVGVSVRTLHHYDNIDLLNPSNRSEKGYRLYAEKDLRKLQTIQALKFLGFDLNQIKQILENNSDIDFEKQRNIIKGQIASLKNVDQCLKELSYKSLVTYQDIIKLMEVYKMSDDFKNTWMSKLFSEKQLKTFAEYRQNFTDEEMIKYSKDWEKLIKEVEKHIHEDPNSDIGKKYAKKWMDLVNKFWKGHELGDVIWDCYRKNKFPKGDLDYWPNISQDVVKWIDKAVASMYKN